MAAPIRGTIAETYLRRRGIAFVHNSSAEPPPGLRRLYIVCDNDDAGRRAAETLAVRAAEMGIETLTLMPTAGDFNDDLRLVSREGRAKWPRCSTPSTAYRIGICSGHAVKITRQILNSMLGIFSGVDRA